MLRRDFAGAEAGRDLRLLRVVPDGRLRRFGKTQEAEEGHRGGGWITRLSTYFRMYEGAS